MRLKLDSNDYEEKLREIRAALNRIPKYMENPEFKKAIENTQRVAAALGNMVVAISQSCLLYTSPSPRDRQKSRMPSSA